MGPEERMTEERMIAMQKKTGRPAGKVSSRPRELGARRNFSRPGVSERISGLDPSLAKLACCRRSCALGVIFPMCFWSPFLLQQSLQRDSEPRGRLSLGATANASSSRVEVRYLTHLLSFRTG